MWRETIQGCGTESLPASFLGVGIGGTADVALVDAKKAVQQVVMNSQHPDPFCTELGYRIHERCNNTESGPLGFRGTSTVAGVCIKERTCRHTSRCPESQLPLSTVPAGDF